MSDWSSDVCSSDLAGFALFADNMIGFRSDPVVLGTIALLIIVGGLGFPVWAQIGRRPWGPQGWDLHAKLTVSVTVVLLLGGAVLFTWWEWTNPATLGGLSWFDASVNGFFHKIGRAHV